MLIAAPNCVSGKKILLVDDDPVFTLGVSLILRGEGFEVLTAKDRASALSALHQFKADLILMDIFFPPDIEQGGPSWDGFRIMDWLRCLEGFGNTPVILLTAADQSEYVDRAREAGAVGLFQKTVETAELLGVIHQLLD